MPTRGSGGNVLAHLRTTLLPVGLFLCVLLLLISLMLSLTFPTWGLSPAFAAEDTEGEATDGKDASSGASLDAIKDLADGTYQIEVTMTGGSGKASVESPAVLEIEDGKPFVTLVWSSENYDYMLVDGKKITPISTTPTSTFKVPVLAFDKAYEMVGDTTAMGAPHEITYEFTFDSSTIKAYPAEQVSLPGSSDGTAADSDAQQQQESKSPDRSKVSLFITVGSLALAAIAIGVTIGLLLAYRQRN